jgi:hypothetical protein
MDDEPEEGEVGIMPYNVIRDMVNRYVTAVRIFDKQLETAVELNTALSSFYSSSVGFALHEDSKPKSRSDFKKDLQRSAWKYIFSKMDLEKHSTRKLREDINTFIEKQTHIPFTMKNVYRMLEIISGTTQQRMDAAMLEVFDRLTEHHDDNRFGVEGWKTNSHYLLTRKFILPRMCEQEKYDKGKNRPSQTYGAYFDLIEDFVKAICFMTGDNYDKIGTLGDYIRYKYRVITNDKVRSFGGQDYEWRALVQYKKELYEAGISYTEDTHECEYGKKFSWAFFDIVAYKKGTMHFTIRDEDLWARFNQLIAKMKGYPLFESKKQTEYQKKQTGRSESESHKENAEELFSIKFN